jgi:DNA-binding transcriptional regulator YdaS (Cro superfamily)
LSIFGILPGMKNKTPILLEVFAAVGSMSELARQLNVTRAAVNQWRSVPFRHLSQISKITGIPRQKLRPDLYD